MKKFWIVSLLILIIGFALRVLVVVNTEDTEASSYSSLVKVTLNYRWSKEQLRSEIGKWQDGQFFTEKLFVLKEGEVDFSELNSQLRLSNHPPLYYAILHLIVAITPNTQPTIQNGLFFNLVICLITTLMFYKLCWKIYENRWIAFFGTYVLIFSIGSMQTLTLQKGYELMTFFILAQVYFVIQQISSKQLKSHNYFLFFGACLGGFLTHYYAYPITAILCAIIGFHYLIVQRNLSRVLGYAVTVMLAIATAVLIYPKTIKDVLDNSKSKQIQEGLSSFDPVHRFVKMLGDLVVIYSGRLIIIFLVMIVVLIMVQRYKSGKIDTRKWIQANYRILYIIVFGFVTFFLIKAITPSNSIRFVAPIIPMLLMVVISIFHQALRIRQLLMIIFMILLGGHTSNKIFGAISESKMSRRIITGWDVKSGMDAIEKDEPVLILTNKTGERLRPLLFHMAPRQGAISLNKLDTVLLNERTNAVVLLDHKFPNEIQIKFDSELKALGYVTVGQVRKFPLYRKFPIN